MSTEKEKSQAELELEEDVVHDLCNMLATISNSCEVAAAAVEPDSKASRAIDRALEAADRSAGLVERISAFRQRPGPEEATGSVAPVAEKDIEATDPPQDSAGSVCGDRVLVVDDEQTLLATVTDMLEGKGYRVTSFSSSHEALAAVEQAPDDWDLVLSDQTMPGMTGSQILRAFRSLRRDLPVVIMTGHDEMLTDDAETGVGADGVLYKPFRSAALVEMIRLVLGSGPTRAVA